MPATDVAVNYTGERINDAVAQFIRNTRPLLPYAGVAIGDAIDSGITMQAQNGDDPTGADQLFNTVVDPHLGANLNAMA